MRGGTTTKEDIKALETFWRNTEYLQKLRNVSNERLAQTIKVSRATLQEHKAHPIRTTGAEIVRVARHFGIPTEQMLLPLITQEVKSAVI